MKNHFKSLCAICLIIGSMVVSHAQESPTSSLGNGRIEPHFLEVTYNKTSHLIFPAAIRYVDLGSEFLIAGKADGAENVLRVKASSRTFGLETNFSVITDDGLFYNFDVRYSLDPETLSYDLSGMQKTVGARGSADVLFGELGDSPPFLVDRAMAAIYKKDGRILKHKRTKSFGIEFILKGIYIHNGKYLFHTELCNGTNVPYEIDLINFKVVDRKRTKRTVVQERSMEVLRSYGPITKVKANSKDKNVFLMDQFTLAEGKVFLIQIFEKNGGRHLSLKVKNPDLIRARLINKMQWN